MRSKIFSVLWLFLIAVLIFQLNACTLFWVGMGASDDASSKKKITPVSSSAVQVIKPGARIKIFFKSGESLKGKYAGMARVSESEYAKTYAEKREQVKDEIAIPAFGESIIITTTQGIRLRDVFFGFDYESVAIRPKKTSGTDRIDLRQIRSIRTNNGHVIAAEDVRKLLTQGRIPSLSSGIYLKKKVSTARIPWREIYKIHTIRRKGKLTGLIFGLAVDAAWITGVSIAFADW